MPDVAEARGVRPPVGPWVWGCPVSEGRAVMASVGVAGTLGPLPAGQVRHGAGGVPGGPVLLPLGWLPAVGLAQARRVVLGVAGFLLGLGAGTLCGCAVPGGSRAGYRLPPYLWGRVGLRSWQVVLGVPGSLWPRGVVLVVVAPPVWTHALVGGSVVCRPQMVPDRLQSAWRRRRVVGVVRRRVQGGRSWMGRRMWRTSRLTFGPVRSWP